jgi:hypothetical protein
MESNEAYFLYSHVQGNECANSRRPWLYWVYELSAPISETICLNAGTKSDNPYYCDNIGSQLE